MTVRSFVPADEPAVRSLQRHLEYADPDLIAATLDGPFVGFVAVESGSVVGYALALPGREATLSELVVAPETRRSGHGRRLVETTATAVATDAVVVTTPTSETATRRFYEALGFDLDERMREFYADGADALRLVRRE